MSRWYGRMYPLREKSRDILGGNEDILVGKQQGTLAMTAGANSFILWEH